MTLPFSGYIALTFRQPYVSVTFMAASLPALPVVAASIVAAYMYLRRRRKSGKPLHSGPSGLPIVGNLFDVPVDFQWLKYAEWSKKFGTSEPLQCAEAVLTSNKPRMSSTSTLAGCQ